MGNYIGYLMLHHKLPQSLRLRTANTYCLSQHPWVEISGGASWDSSGSRSLVRLKGRCPYGSSFQPSESLRRGAGVGVSK